MGVVAVAFVWVTDGTEMELALLLRIMWSVGITAVGASATYKRLLHVILC